MVYFLCGKCDLRNATGVEPMAFLKLLAIRKLSENPHSSAIDDSGISVSRSNSAALRIRIELRYARGVVPAAARK